MSENLVEEILFPQEKLTELLQNENVRIVGRVLAVLENKKTGKKKLIHGVNVVTNDGDKYYAQMACEEAPDDDFDHATVAGLRLGSDNTTPVKADIDVTTFLAGTDHILDATYERTADPDPDNAAGAGADIITWRYSYTTAEGNQNGIIEGAIVDDKGTPTAALTHFLFAASFNKTSNDTLKVFVNHEMNGV